MIFITDNLLWFIFYTLLTLMIILTCFYFKDEIDHDRKRNVVVYGIILTILLWIFANVIKLRGAYLYQKGHLKVNFEKVE